MKKFFAKLTATGVVLFTLTAKGNFESIANLEGTGKGFSLTKVTAQKTTLKSGGEEPADEFLDVLNLQNVKLVTPGNTETGEGYVFTSVYQNLMNKPQYALLTITTTGWSSPANITAALCTAEGTLLNEVGTATDRTKGTSTEGKNSATGHITPEMLQKAVEGGKSVTGTTSVTIEALQKAFLNNERIGIPVNIEGNTGTYNTKLLEKPEANTWNGIFTVAEKEYGMVLVNDGQSVNYTITANAPAAATT